MAENDLAKRTLTIRKTFDASVELVWEAWTQPEHIAKWWGPKGMSINVVEHNFKVGGTWKYVMPMPGGGEFISEGMYSEIVKFQRIVTSANFRPMTEGVELRILFERSGDQNQFHFQCCSSDRGILQAAGENGILQRLGINAVKVRSYAAARKMTH